jgi:uncharacterized protein (DUF849 family)
MTNKTIITCALTGGHNSYANNFRGHPDYPVSPEQIANDAIEAARAGAAIAHIHVRDPQTGARSGDPALFREVVQRIRDSGSDVLINLTSSEGARFIPGMDDPKTGGEGTTLIKPLDRLRHIEELRPDICTLDVGTFNFGDVIFVNTPQDLRIMAKRIAEIGVKPEIEVFELGHIEFARKLIDEGLIKAPPMFQICLGIPHAAPAAPEVLNLMYRRLPENAQWSAFGISRDEFKIAAQSVSLSGNVRVGLEDNLYLGKGEFASNVKLVEKAVRVIRELGAEPAEPSWARQVLGIT